MKRLLFALTVIAFALFVQPAPVNAQALMSQKSTAGVAKTTHTNADTSYHSIDLAGQTNNFHFFTITLAGTKTSGTVGGSAIVQGSMDNLRWFSVADSSGVTTQSLADGDNDKKWEYLHTKWRYYRVKVITSGTQVSTYKCWALGRKVPN